MSPPSPGTRREHVSARRRGTPNGRAQEEQTANRGDRSNIGTTPQPPESESESEWSRVSRRRHAPWEMRQPAGPPGPKANPWEMRRRSLHKEEIRIATTGHGEERKRHCLSCPNTNWTPSLSLTTQPDGFLQPATHGSLSQVLTIVFSLPAGSPTERSR